ncbi:hypothetical protein HPB50_009884 [Hyalomma asiaticum]|uniref:Uncharacterized protein n=1 Tax=Hyalomma asiaticum TaxID=266040 RepID=A0ACB7RIG5_HYAAI|nr:hypothetical protein HPB50_009884 [Hyalomma asiaticum]
MSAPISDLVVACGAVAKLTHLSPPAMDESLFRERSHLSCLLPPEAPSVVCLPPALRSSPEELVAIGLWGTIFSAPARSAPRNARRYMERGRDRSPLMDAIF